MISRSTRTVLVSACWMVGTMRLVKSQITCRESSAIVKISHCRCGQVWWLQAPFNIGFVYVFLTGVCSENALHQQSVKLWFSSEADQLFKSFCSGFRSLIHAELIFWRFFHGRWAWFGGSVPLVLEQHELLVWKKHLQKQMQVCANSDEVPDIQRLFKAIMHSVHQLDLSISFTETTEVAKTFPEWYFEAINEIDLVQDVCDVIFRNTVSAD